MSANTTVETYPTVNLRRPEIDRLNSHLCALLYTDPDPNNIYQTCSDEIVEIVEDAAPVACADLRLGRSHLENKAGFMVVKGTRIESAHPLLAELTTIALSSVLGRPTKTDQHKSQIAWPIRFDPSAGENSTFSQTMGEAEFHTDTQYFMNPERYFGLFCVRADSPGKGTNRLIDGELIQKQVKQESPKLLDTLGEDYPFRVPAVFTKNASDKDIEIVWAPILQQNGLIRYRRDTILKALDVSDVTITQKQVEALEIFDRLLNNIEPVEHHLHPGEALFVNNHRLLHARTPYDNPARLLYRVRMEVSNAKAS